MPDPAAPQEGGDRVHLAGAARKANRRGLQERVALARAEVEANLARLAESRRHMTAVLDEVSGARTGREAQHQSAFAHLQARLDSLPVLEQAKGIVMARARCGPEEAFEILRSAAQRRGVQLPDLASETVRQAVQARSRPAAAADPRSRPAPTNPGPTIGRPAALSSRPGRVRPEG